MTVLKCVSSQVIAPVRIGDNRNQPYTDPAIEFVISAFHDMHHGDNLVAQSKLNRLSAITKRWVNVEIRMLLEQLKKCHNRPLRTQLTPDGLDELDRLCCRSSGGSFNAICNALRLINVGYYHFSEILINSLGMSEPERSLYINLCTECLCTTTVEHI